MLQITQQPIEKFIWYVKSVIFPNILSEPGVVFIVIMEG